jgi:regulator of sigma E protease
MLNILQNVAIYLIPFLLVLTLVVTVHELGHFWVARAFGVAVDRFSIGFGHAILSWRDKSGVDWRIGWIPLGGYVRFAGDANAASVPDADGLAHMRDWIDKHDGPEGYKKYYHFKPIWQRAAIAAAGPFANFALAILLFAVILLSFGDNVVPAKVSTVQPGSVAAQAGFKPGDVITRLDGRRVKNFEQVSRYVAVRGGASIDFVVDRGGVALAIIATPARVMAEQPVGGVREVGRLGIGSQPRREDVQHITYNPITAIGGGAARTWEVLETTVYYLGRLIRGQVSADQIGGPIGIAQTSGQAAQYGGEGAPNFGYWLLGAFVVLIQLAAGLSVSVGFMNLLPIPVLDGGHLLFYAYEAVARRPLGARAQAAGYRVGLALLLSFMLFATWNDLQRLRVFSFLGGLFS